MLDKKIKILEQIFGDYICTRQKNGQEFLFHCPKCNHHKNKLSFNLDKNYFKCWICLWSGKSIFWAVKTFGDQNQINLWNELEGNIDFAHQKELEEFLEQKIELPKEFVTLTSNKFNILTSQALKYLKNDRNLSFEDILWWKIGVCFEGKYKQRIVVPSYDLNGECNYFIARSFTNHPIPYLNPAHNKDIIFNELFIDFEKDVVLTEGVFDAIVARNSIPLLGSSLQEDSYVFKTIVNKCSKIFLALDPDAEEKENKIINSFLMYGLDVFKINVKPYKDIGDMNKEQFEFRKNNAFRISKENDIEMALG